MKKILLVLFVVSLLAFASCNKVREAEPTNEVDSTNVVVDSVSVDSTAVEVDSTAVQ